MKNENLILGAAFTLAAFAIVKKNSNYGINGLSKIEKEIAAAQKAIELLPTRHALAPDDYRQGGRKAGQSYNAMYAEERGELTKSKLPAVLKRMLEAGFAHSNMWHHTGQFKGHMNETLFYAASDFDLPGYADYLNNKESIDAQRQDAAHSQAQAEAVKRQAAAELDLRKENWLKENAVYLVRVPRRLFIETAQEMNGKYGWFDSRTKSYNLPEYYTGWELKENANREDYYAIGYLRYAV